MEQAFRNLKTVCCEIRPVHRKSGDRIRSHVFLCMLADYLLWHFLERVEPHFAEQQDALDTKRIRPKDRAVTLEGVLESLKRCAATGCGWAARSSLRSANQPARNGASSNCSGSNCRAAVAIPRIGEMAL